MIDAYVFWRLVVSEEAGVVMARVEVGFGVVRLVLGIATLFSYMLAGEARADLILYRFDFGPADSATGFATSIVGVTDPNFTLSAITGSTGSAYSTSSVSNNYGGASGGFNLPNTFSSGDFSLATSDYVTLSVTNNTGTIQYLTDFDFGVRSTATGPRAYSLRSSNSGFAADIVSGTIEADTFWSFKNNTFSQVAIGNGTTEFRLFGYNGTGTGINGRFDDFAIQFNITAVPEPSSMALVGFMGGVATVWGWRKRRSEGKVTEH